MERPQAILFDVDGVLTEANIHEPIVIGIQGSSAVHEQTANVLQAAARVQREVGCAVSLHPGWGVAGALGAARLGRCPGGGRR